MMQWNLSISGIKKFALQTFLVALGSTLCAAPVGNTAAPQLCEEGFFISRDSWIDVRIGYEGDFVGNGRLKQCQEGSGRVDSFQQYTNSGTATLNILDRLDLFAVFGSSRVNADWRFTNLSGLATRAQLETLYHYIWAAGARGILFEWDQVALGLGGRYSYCTYKPSLLTINAVPVSVGSARCIWREWQIDLDISYKIDLFTPYIGVKYSRAEARIGPFSTPISNSGSGTDHFKNKTPVGLFLGCSLSTGKYFMLNVEGRLIDEDAITISGDLRF
jgi:hypothetical protein